MLIHSLFLLPAFPTSLSVFCTGSNEGRESSQNPFWENVTGCFFLSLLSHVCAFPLKATIKNPERTYPALSEGVIEGNKLYCYSGMLPTAPPPHVCPLLSPPLQGKTSLSLPIQISFTLETHVHLVSSKKPSLGWSAHTELNLP